MAVKVKKQSRVEYDSALHRVENLSDAILIGETYEHTGQFPQHSQDIPRAGIRHSNIKFDEEVAGSGTAGDVPPIDAMLIACGMKKDVAAGVSVTYSTDNAPFDDNTTAVDIVSHYGNVQKQACNDAIGDLVMVFEPGKPCIATFDMDGLFAAITEGAAVAALVTTARSPICLNMTLTVGGASHVPSRFEFGLRNENNAPRLDLTDANGVIEANIIGYSPYCKVIFENPDIGTKDFAAEWASETKAAVNVVLGSVAGNIMTLAGDFYQESFPGFGTNNGIESIEVMLVRSYQTGDAAPTIVFT